MEFGYTIPLQKHLKMAFPSSKPTIAPFFCWTVHILTIQQRIGRICRGFCKMKSERPSCGRGFQSMRLFGISP